MATITWLHLSDLHFRTGSVYRWDSDIVLKKLLDDVRDRITQDGLAPDLILVSGDIAYSGAAQEYALARQFFDELLGVAGLPKSRLFVVPGNHDVDWTAISPGARAIANSLDSREAIRDVLLSDEDRRLIFRKFRGYADFVNSYFEGGLAFDAERYFYVHYPDLSDRFPDGAAPRVAVLGLNSAWLSQETQDKGRLALGEVQVIQAVAAVRDADLRIALLHHPREYLQDSDSDLYDGELMSKCHFILHGHLHQTGLLGVWTPDTSAMVISAGSGFETRQSHNSYNLVQLDPAAGNGTAVLRAWSDRRGGFWHKDVETYRNVSDGRFTFALTLLTKERKAQADSERPAEGQQQAARRYLTYLVDRYRYLDFVGMGISDRVPLRLPLVEMYVPLKARTELPEGDAWPRELRLAGRSLSEDEVREVGRRLGELIPVLDLLRQDDGLIILGDPGAGKTTFLKYLALRLALSEGDDLGLGTRLPVLLPLSAYANALARRDVPLDVFFAEYCQNRGLDLPLGPVLDQALARGEALLLLDGLDEVRDLDQRHLVVRRVADFFAFHRRKGNKFILTSRIVGYREVRPVVEGLAECTLVDFEDAEIRQFVDKWTAALEHAARGETVIAVQEATRQREELLAAVQRNPGVRGLAANPLLLTILALMKRQGVVLPERRVELYQKYVETLLKHWNLARGLDRPPSRDLDVVETVRVLAPLALWMHETSPGVGLVKRESMRRKLEEIYAARGIAAPEQTARRLLADARDYAGLLVERGPGEYGFIHLTFQEYLAAVGIAFRGQQDVGPIVEALSNHLGDDNWHEVSLLTVGHVGIVQQRDEAAGAALGQLIQAAPGEPGQAVTFAGEAVLDAWPGGVTPTCRAAIVQALQGTMADDRQVKPALRAAAGRTLAKLGDPRPGIGLSPLPVGEGLAVRALPDLAWCSVPSGPFLMGSQGDPQAYKNEEPQHSEDIPYGYWISRYPITNAQYASFVAAGGYRDGRYWREAQAAGFWSSQGVAMWRDEKPRDRPRDPGEPFNLPNHPAVNVSWYEAVAFCRWMTEQITDSRWQTAGGGQAQLSVIRGSQFVVRLPTEAEWEKAARGPDGRIYPWGKEPDPNRANYDQSGIGSTSAVGCFPGGASPYGVRDMAGNVWEWCQTHWRDNYKTKADESFEGQGRRVWRGGAFNLTQRYVRCAYRYRYDPDDWDLNVGFRVVVAPGLPLASDPSGLWRSETQAL